MSDGSNLMEGAECEMEETKCESRCPFLVLVLVLVLLRHLRSADNDC